MSGSQYDCNPTSYIKLYVQHGTVTDTQTEAPEAVPDYEPKKD